MNEYTNRKSKESSLSGKANGSNNNSHVVAENGQSRKLTVDDVRGKPMMQLKNGGGESGEQNKNNDNGNSMTDDGAVNDISNENAKLNRQSSGETSIDDVNNKLTSHAFQSYDEQEHLESKEIQSPTIENIPI